MQGGGVEQGAMLKNQGSQSGLLSVVQGAEARHRLSNVNGLELWHYEDYRLRL